jgi:hypothetical protein
MIFYNYGMMFFLVIYNLCIYVAIAILIYIIIQCLTDLNIKGAKYVKQKAESRLKNPYESLPDIIHDNVQAIHFYIPDRFMSLLIALSIIKINYLTDLYKNITCLVICLILRSFVIGFTILPSCIPDNRINKKLSFYDKCFLSSHDLMFSGHTICYFFFANILGFNIIKLIGPFLSVASRQHYTIDVLVASVVYSYIFLILPHF